MTYLSYVSGQLYSQLLLSQFLRLLHLLFLFSEKQPWYIACFETGKGINEFK